MRDYIVLAIILGSVPAAFLNPFFGVLMWTWVAYFNPHRFTWGVAYTFPVAMVLAVPTIVGTLFTKERNRNVLTRETVLLFLLWIWFGITLFHATLVPLLSMHVGDGRTQLEIITKILVMTGLTILLTNSPQRLRLLLLVTAVSFGALALKGAIFGIRNGGDFRVWGPPDSFVADNNDFGLALNIALPLMFFMAGSESNRKIRLVLRICFFASALVVLLTYSRGALLGIATAMAFIVIKTRHKLLGGVALALAVLAILSLAPQKWQQRMDNFFAGKLDQSAHQRLVSWKFAWNVAETYPVTGGGMQCFTPEMFARFSKEELPGGGLSSGPHSIYFQILGEQGFVGLGLFLSLIAACILSLRKLRRLVRDAQPLQWIVPYANGIEGGLCAFLVSGAFLGRAYFDLFYQLVACTIILKVLYRREVLHLLTEPVNTSSVNTVETEEISTYSRRVSV
jgi:probable O-glycosylation ligase (exosortase A-associated)